MSCRSHCDLSEAKGDDLSPPKSPPSSSGATALKQTLRGGEAHISSTRQLAHNVSLIVLRSSMSD